MVSEQRTTIKSKVVHGLKKQCGGDPCSCLKPLIFVCRTFMMLSRSNCVYTVVYLSVKNKVTDINRSFAQLGCFSQMFSSHFFSLPRSILTAMCMIQADEHCRLGSPCPVVHNLRRYHTTVRLAQHRHERPRMSCSSWHSKQSSVSCAIFSRF